MPSLRLLGLAAFAALAPSYATAIPQGQSSGAAAKRQTEFFEVSGCHAHGDTLFCIYEGEEWEVTGDVDVENAPTSFEGCHSHGETEL